jgi:MFS family permease
VTNDLPAARGTTTSAPDAALPFPSLTEQPLRPSKNTTDSGTKRAPRLGLDLGLLMPAAVGMYAVFNGMQGVLLPQQVQALSNGNGNEVNMLAVLAAGGALLAAIANPLAGALSDRTRSRFGRRAPWLLATSVLAALALLLLAGQTSYFLLGAIYFLVMLAMGSFQAVLTAIVPDRVPATRRGMASSIVGLATPIGILYGVHMVSKVFTEPLAGYGLLGGTLVVFTALFVFLTRDAPAVDAPAPRSKRPLAESLALFFASFRHADFTWAFFARAVIMFGFFSITGYLLFTLQKYIDPDTIPDGNAVAAVGTLTTINVVALLVGTAVSGWLSDLIQRRKIVVIGSAIITALSLAIPLISPTFGAMIWFEIIFGFGFGAYIAIDTALMTLVLPGDGDNARDLGILNVASTGPQVLSQFIAAIIIGYAGGYAGLFVFAIVCAVLGAIAIIPIKGVR